MIRRENKSSFEPAEQCLEEQTCPDEFTQHPNGIQTPATTYSLSSQNVLRARRGVIRMLIVVVLTFAICNLPYHARKMWQYWSEDYDGSSNFSTLFTPLTFLVTYINSGVNPLLYAFLSRNFRKGMRELLMCSVHSTKTAGRGASRKCSSRKSELQMQTCPSVKLRRGPSVLSKIDNCTIFR